MATHSSILAWEIPWTEKPSGLLGRANSLEKTLMLGKTEGERRRGQQRMRWLDSITNSTLGDSEGQGSLACCSPWSCKESDMAE